MKRLVTPVLAAVLALAAPLAADAAILATAPLSSTVDAGTAQCVVSNIGTKTVQVTVTIVNASGAVVVGGFGPTPLGGGATTETPEIDLGVDNVSYCKCQVPSKANSRCSLVYKNGGAVTIIPAR